MAVTIKGIRIDSLTLTRKEGDGSTEVAASYALISSDDRVLARQSIGGYDSSVKVSPSPDTTKAFREALDKFRADINRVLGLE